jgi:hypothetical protein
MIRNFKLFMNAVRKVQRLFIIKRESTPFRIQAYKEILNYYVMKQLAIEHAKLKHLRSRKALKSILSQIEKLIAGLEKVQSKLGLVAIGVHRLTVTRQQLAIFTFAVHRLHKENSAVRESAIKNQQFYLAQAIQLLDILIED